MQQIIDKLQRVEQEQKRRQRSPLARYNKNKVHVKQMAFHKCQKRNRWVFGGNRSGKTECGAVETVWLCRGIHPYRPNKRDVSCWVVSLSREVQRDVAQRKVLHYLDPGWIQDVVMVSGNKHNPAGGVIDYVTVKNVFGGLSTIAFKSCEAGRDKFQGVSLDFVWFDEEPPKDVYEECRMRVIDRQGHVFGTMTPLKGLTWVYDEIYLNCHNSDDVWCTFMEWADNPYLSREEIATLSQTLSADALQSRRYGRFTSGGGMVYSEFSEANVIEPFDIPVDWQDKLSIDPGLKNPLSCHWYARDGDGNVFVVAEHYVAGQNVAYHAERILDICQKLNWHTVDGKPQALMDSAANQRTLNGERSVAELFEQHGIGVDTRVNKDLYTGINRVKAMLKPLVGPPKLFIFSSCVNMIREIKGYSWGNGDAPIKRDDHAMDELRYYVSSLEDGQNKRMDGYLTSGALAVAKASKQTLTAVQKDKRKLMRQNKNASTYPF